MPSKYHKPRRSHAYPRDKLLPRRAWKFIAIAAGLILIFVLLSSSSRSSAASQLTYSRSTAHQPPVQPNSTSGDAKWYSDWKWHNPFSFAITQDETRSVLPPLRKRPPIYTFYDSDTSASEALQLAEISLLQIWRKAWWAKGFRPVVLGRAEAMMNPLYERVPKKSMEKAMRTEFLRWLAWAQMGTGILADWLVLPMGPYDDHLLSFLRRGTYPELTRYDGFGNGFFVGDAASISNAIEEALDSDPAKGSQNFFDITAPKTFMVDKKPSALAFYETSVLEELYEASSTSLPRDDPSASLKMLAGLITSHLHQTFLETFASGLSVLTPFEPSASVLTKSAVQIAKSLVACPSSPIPSSCPPNHPRCSPCSSSAPFPTNTPESFINASTLFTIGTISHPYTLASLLARRKEITVRHIRRDTERDPWLTATTQLTLGKKLGGPSRIVHFKEIVASEWGAARGLWLTDEWDPSRQDLEWHFGFELAAYKNHTTTTLPLLDHMIPHTAAGGRRDAAEEKAMLRQQALIDAARPIVQKGGRGRSSGIRDAVEAWNLADTEAWRFVRAFRAREGMERRKWEDEERKFAGGGGGGLGGRRWFDNIV